jgi:hypothetical protein
MFSDVAGDLRHATRTLRKNPGFSLTALVTLTLAIGANSAIFTLANALILASLPAPHPDRLLEISTLDSKGAKGNLSIPAFQAIEQQANVFESVLAWNGGGMENIEMNGTPFAGSADEVAGDYYKTLGIRPAAGRFITREDIGLDHFTPSNVAVIGYRAWQERYHGDPAAVGKAILINGKSYTIIGVHPKSFPGLIPRSRRGCDRSAHSLRVERGTSVRSQVGLLHGDRTAPRWRRCGAGAGAAQDHLAHDTPGDGARWRSPT